MKLDEKYFKGKLDEIASEDCYDVSDILMQIARDAAEAQRERCWKQLVCDLRYGCSKCPSRLAIPDGE